MPGTLQFQATESGLAFELLLKGMQDRHTYANALYTTPKQRNPPLESEGFSSVGGASLTQSTRAPWSIELVAA